MAKTNDALSRPNIVLIMSDEHDPRVTGCYGHPTIVTPNLDRLAREGAVFENAYTNCPICVPARASFMTGLYVHQHGCWDNSAPFRSGLPTIGSYLEAEGYDTVLWQRDNILHLFVQNVGQGDSETLEDIPPQMISVLEWRPE